jgi:hypothetical protein
LKDLRRFVRSWRSRLRMGWLSDIDQATSAGVQYKCQQAWPNGWPALDA